MEQGTPNRKRNTVLKDLRERLRLKSKLEFKSQLILYMPDCIPTTIYVCSFTDALYSLLSNQQLMRQENISLLIEDSLLITPSFVRKKMKLSNPVTELHHGNWWLDT